MNTKKNIKKNNQIIKMFETIRESSILEYDEINPNEYISVDHFLRIFNAKYHGDIQLPNFEGPAVTVNKSGYGYVVLPPSDCFDNNMDYIYKISQDIVKLDNKVKGWVIDLRCNGGGSIMVFMLFALIFIPSEYEGLLFSMIKDSDDILFDLSVYNGTLYMRIKYLQGIEVFDIKEKLRRLKNTKNVKILVDEKSGSASEYISLILKSFGAKVYGAHESTMGLLNMSMGYIIDESTSIFFPNAYVYGKDNFKNNIYLTTEKNIKSEFLLP